jgi:hypothetical protein
MLSVVPHQIDALQPGIHRRECLYRRPTVVPAAVIDENGLKRDAYSGQNNIEPLDQSRQARLAVEHWDDDRDSGCD